MEKLHSLRAEVLRTFAKFDRPSSYIDYDLYEPKRLDYEEMLGGRPREAVDVLNFGSVSWSPLLALTPEAMVCMLPRLIELASDPAEGDKDGEPFMMRFINLASIGPDAPAFSLLEHPQRDLVRRFLEYLAEEHSQLIANECWDETLAEALQAWRGA